MKDELGPDSFRESGAEQNAKHRKGGFLLGSAFLIYRSLCMEGVAISSSLFVESKGVI